MGCHRARHDGKRGEQCSLPLSLLALNTRARMRGGWVRSRVASGGVRWGEANHPGVGGGWGGGRMHKVPRNHPKLTKRRPHACWGSTTSLATPLKSPTLGRAGGGARRPVDTVAAGKEEGRSSLFAIQRPHRRCKTPQLSSRPTQQQQQQSLLHNTFSIFHWNDNNPRRP